MTAKPIETPKRSCTDCMANPCACWCRHADQVEVVEDEDFDLEAMFPVPPATSCRSADARLAHATNKRGW